MIGKLVISSIGASMFLLVACVQAPPFQEHVGEYKDPHVIMIGGEIESGQIPHNPDCPHALIYSSDAETVESCETAANVVTAVCDRAESAANGLAQTVQCPDPGVCPLRADGRIYKGWSCGGNPTPVVVTCGVEVEVICWNMF